MQTVRNVLFIMADQMRADCLGAAGHPVVKTPHLDRMAEMGVRFERSYVQTAVCGPSRACFLTGRYTHAHRSYWNGVPLPADEMTLAHYARERGMKAALCGKLHQLPDERFLERVFSGSGDSRRRQFDNAGFDVWEALELVGDGWLSYLASRGYILPDPDPRVGAFVVRRPDGKLVNGWRPEAAAYPTVIREEDSDTAYLTRRAMEYIEEAGEAPWLLHLSYFKPHWPNVAPEPFHDMYDPSLSPEPVRDEGELRDPHPLLVPFREERRSLPFDDQETWRQARATYYGLISQLDHHIGKLLHFLEESGRLRDTLIVFTADHGEYMGDHWLFEKELFYEPAIRVPMVVYDPSPTADSTRGRTDSRFVESVDVLPTCLEALGMEVPSYVQGRSLLPLVRGEEVGDWRKAVFGDWDFRSHASSERISLNPEQCRAWMVRDDEFKYIHFNALPPILFDLTRDPNELNNVAEREECRDIVGRYQRVLLEWRQSTEDSSRSGSNARSGVQVPDHELG